LEVAQIAKSIAIKLNSTAPFFNRPGFKIDTDLVETAALAHDIGHPPFGHNGEAALDEAMKHKGGFEGNAQTLRILTRTEKRQKSRKSSSYGVRDGGSDGRFGLNLCYRTLAAFLKYDNEIPLRRNAGERLAKGYYYTERQIVRQIKENVCGEVPPSEPFKTVECQIMDLADDIAYSTYDLEDAFKGGFVRLLDLLAITPEFSAQICGEVGRRIGSSFTPDELFACLFRLFGRFVMNVDAAATSHMSQEQFVRSLLISHRVSDEMARDGYLRSQLTSDLVRRFIGGVEVEQENEKIPPLSKIRLTRQVLEEVEVLKIFTFESIIMSPRLQVSEYRGREIVTKIFEVLTDYDRFGFRLLPEDVRSLHQEIDGGLQDRVICDFIAGMTDRYAIEFYGRLQSENPETIFKPL
jgi:dGTPase